MSIKTPILLPNRPRFYFRFINLCIKSLMWLMISGFFDKIKLSNINRKFGLYKKVSDIAHRMILLMCMLCLDGKNQKVLDLTLKLSKVTRQYDKAYL